MQKIKLQAIRIYEVATVVDSIPLKDLGTSKDVRLSTNLTKDLLEAVKTYTDALKAYNDKKLTLVEKYKARFDATGYNTSDARLKGAEELDAQLDQEARTTFTEEVKALDEAAKAEVEFELGDDKFATLKSLFEKYGLDKYRSKEAYLQVADALGI